MKCLGVYRGHRLYYDLKHKEYILMTPNFRFTRSMGHCHRPNVAEWARKMIEIHYKLLQKGLIRYKE